MKFITLCILLIISVLLLSRCQKKPANSFDVDHPPDRDEYDEPITFIKQVHPEAYPPSALKDSIQGQVLINSFVNENGLVDSVWVYKSLRYDLDSVAMVAAKRSIFTIPKIKGKPAKAVLTQCFTFHLSKKKK